MNAAGFSGAVYSCLVSVISTLIPNCGMSVQASHGCFRSSFRRFDVKPFDVRLEPNRTYVLFSATTTANKTFLRLHGSLPVTTANNRSLLAWPWAMLYHYDYLGEETVLV